MGKIWEGEERGVYLSTAQAGEVEMGRRGGEVKLCDLGIVELDRDGDKDWRNYSEAGLCG